MSLSSQQYDRLEAALDNAGCTDITVHALAPVVQEMLAEAWDKGKHSEHDANCRLNAEWDCICSNPYRTKETHR